jgi:hypothetical protein
MVSRAPQLDSIRSWVRKLRDRCDYAGIRNRDAYGTWALVTVKVSLKANRINVDVFNSIRTVTDEWDPR